MGMCKKCLAMANKKKQKKTRRRSRVGAINSKGITNTLTSTVLPIAGGVLLSKYLDKVPVIKGMPKYLNYIGLAAGVLGLSYTKSPMLRMISGGLAGVSAANVAQDLLDGQSTAGRMAGLPGPRAYKPLVAGMPSMNGIPSPQEVQKEIVKFR